MLVRRANPMSNKARSLWRRMPRETRLELVPIISTALLVQGGTPTAQFLIRWHEGTPTKPDPDSFAVTDLLGLFILVNFTILFWFTYRSLHLALQKGGDVVVSSKLVGLAGIALSAGELYSYALKAGRPDHLVYGVLLLFYIFFVPFVLMHAVRDHEATLVGTIDEQKHTLLQARIALESVFYALAVCVVVVLLCSTFFVIMNDGISIAGRQLVEAFVDGFFKPYGRVEFWGLTPGILGVGWLQAIIITVSYGPTGPGAMAFGLDQRGRVTVLLATAAINVLLALVLIDDQTLVPSAQIAQAYGWEVKAVKALLGLVLTALFLGAFFLARLVERRANSWPRVGIQTGQAAIFSLAGATLGGVVVCIRLRFGGYVPGMWHLVWMHAAGFALSYGAALLSVGILRRYLPDIDPAIGFR